MFASVNNITDPSTGDVVGYISNAGIPSIANQTVQELDVITPYSVFPTVLFNKGVGMAWWRNMAIAKKMQSEQYPVLPTHCMLANIGKTFTVAPNQPVVMELECQRFSPGIARSPQ